MAHREKIDSYFYCSTSGRLLFRIVLSFCVLGLFRFSVVASDAEKPFTLSVVNLKCEHQINPLGVDATNPSLSWQLEVTDKNDRGQMQSSWQLQVASSPELLGNNKADIWDSGKIKGADCSNIVYGGTVLRSNKKYYWRVKVWDKNGLSSDWSEISFWKTGLFNAGDWQGKWIQNSKRLPEIDSILYNDHPAPLFRKQFSIPKKVKSATLYVGALGYFEAYVNGKSVSKAMLEPGQTEYSKRIFYSSYDVTSVVEQKENCIGIMSGNGWYNPLPLKMWGSINLKKNMTVGQPAFIAQLNIDFEDGTSSSVFSDESWAVADGPILRNNVYLGEHYDSRKVVPGWNSVSFDASNWKPAVKASSPEGKLRAQNQPPVVIGDRLTPLNIYKEGDKQMIDFGRNFGGVIRLKIKTTESKKIYIRYGELLYPDGSLNVMTSTAGQVKKSGIGGPGAPDTAYQQDVFITAGTGVEIFQPKFTYHGFRYAEVSGYAGTLEKGDVEGLVMYADVPEAGTFICSDTLINKIQQACRNTFLSNLFSVQSDCPHREKFGYGGDIVATCEALMNNFDMSSFYRKTVIDFADAARSDGGLTETAPYVGIADKGLGTNGAGPIEWGTVHPELLYRLYQYYADKQLMAQQYPVVKKWVDFLRTHAKNNVIDITIGDHESIDKKDLSVSGTSFYYYNVRLLAYMANILDKKQDVTDYGALAQQIKKTFIDNFVDSVSGKVGMGTQATQSHALYFNLLPETAVQNALQLMEREIRERHNGHIATGMFGTKFLPEMLSRHGKTDLAYQVVTKPGFPGWEYMLANGATTIWEHWAFSDNTFSHNHPMFGVVSEWFFRHLAGIRPADDAVGFNKIIIQPGTKNLTFAKADYFSILGKVSSSWQLQKGELNIDITIPVNATADLFLPAKGIDNIIEGGVTLKKAKGIKIVGENEGIVHLKVGSGVYKFVSNL